MIEVERRPTPTARELLLAPLRTLLFGALNLLEWPMRWAQRHLGQRRIAWLFLAPNLLIFGLFTFLPILLNFWYATTAGIQVLPTDRPYVGMQNFDTLLACDDYLDPSSCEKDIFWRAIYNTASFVVLQVGFMVLFALITALILNREIRARGFFRSVFFYPVLLSPVVVALIWKWVLQRDGVLNAWIMGLGGEQTLWFLDPSWAFFWVVFVSIWAHMGFYTLILLAGLQAIPKDVYEAAKMDSAGSWRTFSCTNWEMISASELSRSRVKTTFTRRSTSPWTEWISLTSSSS